MIGSRLRSSSRLALLLVIAICVSSARGEWALSVEEVPVDRLLSNVQTLLKKEPENAHLNYVAARAYSLKFAQIQSVHVDRKRNLDLEFVSIEIARPDDQPPSEVDLKLLEKSLFHYHRAKLLGSTKTPSEEDQFQRTKLGLAWTIEQAIPYLAHFKTVPWSKSKPTREQLIQTALTIYRQISKARGEADLKETGILRGQEQFLSLEAGQGIIRLLKLLHADVDSLPEVQAIQAHEKAVNSVMRPVTPIIFPIREGASFADLIDNSARLRFDLAGDDVRRAWPWITRDAAFLVWDPSNTGRVTSGRQLFGSATFWMFFRDGYEALASLDDDANGWLEGRELRGISSWQDKNLNGRSDPGEVNPVAALGIDAIRTKSAGVIGEMPYQDAGIRWKDGRMSPTYDWMPTSK